MSKAANLISVRKLKNGEVSYRVDGRPYGAKPARPQFATKEKALAALAAMAEAYAANGGSNSNPSRHDLTFQIQAERYLERNRLNAEGTQGIADKTHRNWQSVINRHLVPALGKKRLLDCNASTLRAFITEKSADPKLGRASIKLISTVLRVIFNSAIDDGLLNVNPMNGIKPPGGRSRSASMARATAISKERVFTQKQIDAILGWCREHDEELATYIFTMLLLGCRKGEARALKWGDVLDDEGKIAVVRNADDRNKISHTKTGVARKSDASPALLEALRAHKIVREQTGHGIADENFIFGNGEPIADASISTRFNKCLDALEIENHSVYDCRHTAASVLYVACRDLLYCARQIGDTPETFLRYYAHMLPDTTTAHANLLDAAYGV